MDLATQSGWADILPMANACRSGFIKLPDGDTGLIGRAFYNWLMPKVESNAYELMCYELPFIGEKTSQKTVDRLYTLQAIFTFVANIQGARYYACNNASVKGHFIKMGTSLRLAKAVKALMSPLELKKAKAEYKGRLKSETIVRCQYKGWEVRNDDEADACAGLDYVTYKEGIKVPWDNTPCMRGLFGEPKPAPSKKEQVAASVLLSKAMQFTGGSE